MNHCTPSKLELDKRLPSYDGALDNLRKILSFTQMGS